MINAGVLAGAPRNERMLAVTAILMSLAVASADLHNARKALGLGVHFKTEQTQLTRRTCHTVFISSAKPLMRESASLASLYLAYQDYKRATSHDVISDFEVGLASWRCKAWALCGATGMANGPYSPYSGLLIWPLEQRLQSRAVFSDSKATELITRWGNMTSCKSIILLASVSVALRAHSPMYMEPWVKTKESGRFLRVSKARLFWSQENRRIVTASGNNRELDL